MLKGVTTSSLLTAVQILTINKNNMGTINNSLKIRYVVIDTITDGEVTELYLFESEAQAAIKVLEKMIRYAGVMKRIVIR